MGVVSRFLIVLVLSASLFMAACSASKKSGMVLGESPSGQTSSFPFGNIDSFPDMTSDEVAAVQTVAQESQQIAPQTEMDWSPEVDDQFNQIIVMEQKGQDTTALRMALSAKMISECATEVAHYRPNPGEPLLGTWATLCGDGTGGGVCTTKGSYSSTDSAGNPKGAASFNYTCLGGGSTATSAGLGKCNADSSGKASCNAVLAVSSGITVTYDALLTDQPQSGSGTFTMKTSSGSTACSVGTTTLATSTNPIPSKYKEGMSKLAACYKRAITLTSPILWEKISKLSPQQQAQLLIAMGIK